MGVAVTPKCKESAYWMNKEREEFRGFNHEFSFHHALYVGYNVTNTLFNTIKIGKGVWGLAPENFTNVLPSMLENPSLQASWIVTRTLWLGL